MMLIYKDENLRRTLIEKAKLQAEKYTWDITASLFWNAIEKTMAAISFRQIINIVFYKTVNSINLHPL